MFVRACKWINCDQTAFGVVEEIVGPPNCGRTLINADFEDESLRIRFELQFLRSWLGLECVVTASKIFVPVVRNLIFLIERDGHVLVQC